jgi:hypothetical protein
MPELESSVQHRFQLSLGHSQFQAIESSHSNKIIFIPGDGLIGFGVAAKKKYEQRPPDKKKRSIHNNRV